MTQLFKLAFRNLGRNKTRSLLSALAVAVGMSLLLLMVAVLEGEMRGAMQTTIRLQSGHLQIRPASYDENKISLKWDDLIADPEQVVQQVKSLPQVTVATPRLIASGILTLSDESKGVQIVGIDPASTANQPFREGMTAGEFIQADDREGILIGKTLADKLNLKVNDKVNLLVNTSNGDVDEQLFTVRGIYSTRTPAYDESAVFMPILKAQTFTATENHASTIFVLLQNSAQSAVDIARAQLTQATLTAPFDGTIASVEISPAEFANPGQVIIVMGDLTHFQIETTDLSEKDVPAVKIGQGATVFIEALNQEFSAKVIDIARVSETVGGDVVYTVTLELNEQPAGLRWGMSAEVTIETK